MVKRDTINKALGLTIAAMMLVLIFTFLTPPTQGVYVYPGVPDDTSVYRGTTITFTNVNVTIRGWERIYIDFFNFTIYSGSTEIAYVKFYINSMIVTQSPSGKFTVTNIINIDALPYSGSSGGYGYDEYTGTNHSFGYGYGYGGGTDIHIIYTITYLTHQTGTFTARLFINSTTHTFASDPSDSTSFTVSESGGGGGGPPEEPEEEPEPEEGVIEPSDDVIDEITDTFGISLPEKFYANDTNGDGVVDTFTDPNGILNNVHSVNLSGNITFLISINDTLIPEFMWDAESNSITLINHAPATITETTIDDEEETITVTISVEKTDWIYIDITDQYPSIPTLIIKDSTGQIIPSTQIWRQNGHIYVLDDPTTTYDIIYNYSILPPTFNPISGTTFIETAMPTIIISYHEPVTIIIATLNTADVHSDITQVDPQTFTFKPSTELANNTYTLTITAEDLEGNEITASATYIIAVPPEAPAPLIPEIPWYWIPIIIVVIIILVIVVLFKIGYLYIEYEEPPKRKF